VQITGYRYTLSPGAPMRISLFGNFTYREAVLFGKALRPLLKDKIKGDRYPGFALDLKEYSCNEKEAESPDFVARYETSKDINYQKMLEREEIRDLLLDAWAEIESKLSGIKIQPGIPSEKTRGWGPMIDVGNGG